MKLGKILALFAASLLATTAAWAGPVAPGTKMDENIVINSFLQADPSTLDISRRMDTYSSAVMQDTMEGLVRLIQEGDHYKLQPMEAKSWDISEDGKTYTFHLRDDIKWQDGKPVTAGQYVYGIRRSADPKVASPNNFFLQPLANFAEVSSGKKPLDQLGVSAPDDHTLVFTLSNPTPTFLRMLNMTLYYPQREDKVKEWGEKFGTEAKYYIGNGAFNLVEWVHNSKIVLKKSDTYFDKANVYPQTVNFAIISDVAAAHNAFLSGQVDSDGAENQEWMKTFQSKNYPYQKVLGNQVLFSTFNCNDPLTKNEKIRKAIALSLDFDLMNEMVYGGLRLPAKGWVLDSEYINGKNFRELAGDHFAVMKKELEDAGKTPRDLFVEGLKELGMDEDPSKVTIHLSFGGTNALIRTLGDYYQQMLSEALGIKVKIDMMDWGVFSDKLSRGEYQMGFMGWGAYYDDPYDLLSLHTSENDMCKTGWKNEQYDKLLADASKEMDEAKRADMLVQAETILIREGMPVVPVLQAVAHAFYQPYLRNYPTLGFATEGDLYLYTEGRK